MSKIDDKKIHAYASFVAELNELQECFSKENDLEKVIEQLLTTMSSLAVVMWEFEMKQIKKKDKL